MVFFTVYNQYGLDGYFIPVRNSFNNTIEKEFIPSGAREIFEKKFGEHIISDQEFLDWYCENTIHF